MLCRVYLQRGDPLSLFPLPLERSLGSCAVGLSGPADGRRRGTDALNLCLRAEAWCGVTNWMDGCAAGWLQREHNGWRERWWTKKSETGLLSENVL